MPTEIQTQYFLPYVSNQKNESSNFSKHLDLCYFTEKREQAFERAHQIAEQCHGYYCISLVNKHFYYLIKKSEIIEKLGKQICNVIRQVHFEANGAAIDKLHYFKRHNQLTPASGIHIIGAGSDAIRYCISRNFYSLALRIYFYFDPIALYNKTPRNDYEASKKYTMLHCDVQNLSLNSLSFTKYILELVKKYNLQLLRSPNVYKDIPLVTMISNCRHLVSRIVHSSDENDVINRAVEIAEMMLVMSDNEMVRKNLSHIYSKSNPFGKENSKSLQLLFARSKKIQDAFERNYISIPEEYRITIVNAPNLFRKPSGISFKACFGCSPTVD